MNIEPAAKATILALDTDKALRVIGPVINASHTLERATLIFYFEGGKYFRLGTDCILPKTFDVTRRRSREIRT